MNKKTKFFIGSMILAFTLSLIPQVSDALCINCGCQKMKRALKADGNYSEEDAEAVAQCHGSAIIFHGPTF